MKPSALIRTLLAAGTVCCATAGTAQTAAPTPPPSGATPAAPSAPAPGAAPATAQAPAAVPAKPEETLDPTAEAERKKAEAIERKKKEAARLQAERDSRCVIKPVMSDAEIARCR